MECVMHGNDVASKEPMDRNALVNKQGQLAVAIIAHLLCRRSRFEVSLCWVLLALFCSSSSK